MITNITVTHTLTLNGNSVTNRLYVVSSLPGTARTITITAASVSASNVDFKDITLSVATDLSAIAGNSGDGGGNSGITFTPAQTLYWFKDTGNFSDSTKWFLATNGGGGAGRTPLPQDSAVFDANSFSAAGKTVTMDMARTGGIDFSNSSNNPTFTTGSNPSTFGSLVFKSGMTASVVGGQLIFYGSGSFTFQPNGVSFGGISNAIPNTLTLLGDYTSSNGFDFSGTFNANNFNVTVTAGIPVWRGTSHITMGSGTWTMSGTGTVLNATTGCVLTPNTSTIVVSNTTATSKTFSGAGLTFNNVTFSGDNITVTGSNSFNTMAVNNAGLTNGLLLTSGTTQTVSKFTTNGSGGNLAKLSAVTSGTAATISKSSGLVSVDYMSIKDSTVLGGASFYAGYHSTNVSGNTGWTFTDPPGSNAQFLSGD